MKFAKTVFTRKNKPIIRMLALVLALCAVLSVCLLACNDNPYKENNNFEVEVNDTDDALTFAPKGFEYSYGVILYVGALVEPEAYTYLGTALAKQGYVTVIPKFNMNMSATYYKDVEPAFEQFPNVKFFIAGHDQGGGAAIRRAQENPNTVAGVILYSPLIVPRLVLDEDGKPDKDEDGKWIYASDSIAEMNIPTLWIESDDVTRTENVRDNIKAHLNMSTVTSHTISPSTSIGFSTAATNSDLTEEQQQAQLDKTVSYTLSYLKNCVAK